MDDIQNTYKSRISACTDAHCEDGPQFKESSELEFLVDCSINQLTWQHCIMVSSECYDCLHQATSSVFTFFFKTRATLNAEIPSDAYISIRYQIGNKQQMQGCGDRETVGTVKRSREMNLSLSRYLHLNRWGVVARTSRGLTHTRTHTHTDAASDKTRKPKLAAGN